MDAGGLNPGMCCRCDLRVAHRALIAIIETGSGPGGSAYACLPCAHDYAKTSRAPGWLADAIAHAEEAGKGWRGQGAETPETPDPGMDPEGPESL